MKLVADATHLGLMLHYLSNFLLQLKNFTPGCKYSSKCVEKGIRDYNEISAGPGYGQSVKWLQAEKENNLIWSQGLKVENL